MKQGTYFATPCLFPKTKVLRSMVSSRKRGETHVRFLDGQFADRRFNSNDGAAARMHETPEEMFDKLQMVGVRESAEGGKEGIGVETIRIACSRAQWAPKSLYIHGTRVKGREVVRGVRVLRYQGTDREYNENVPSDHGPCLVCPINSSATHHPDKADTSSTQWVRTKSSKTLQVMVGVSQWKAKTWVALKLGR